MQSPPAAQPNLEKNKVQIESGRTFWETLFFRFINATDFLFARLQKMIGIKGMAYAFVIPNLLIFGIFILLPMLLNFGYAFTTGSSLFLENREFIATANVEQLFQCEDLFDYRTCREDRFIRAVGNTFFYVIGQVSLMVSVSLLTAIVLNRKIVGRAFFRSVFFYPVLLSPIVVALLWRWILQDNGILNAFIVGFGNFMTNFGFEPTERISFLTQVGTAKIWVILISVWSQMGFYTLILLAGLQAIPHDLYEAADMDGANEWRKFLNVTLPLLMPTMLVVLVLSLIRAVQVFDIVFAFTGGGPGTATLYLVQYIYQNGFVGDKRYGIAAAASLVMAGTLIVLTLIQLALRSREGEF
ncbi:MAG: carbohydrate ABC transporter permease [Anaerolineae bacterium]